MGGLEEKVKRMAEYLDPEAISAALKLPVETVRDILDGKARVQEITAAPQSPPVVQVSSARVAYRQRVIAVWRAKGGVGATSVVLGLAWLLKDMMRVLVVDGAFQAWGSDLVAVLEAPEYPDLSGFESGGINGAVVTVEPNLDVLQPPRNPRELARLSPGILKQAIIAARTTHDVIICDLPNFGAVPHNYVWWVREALEAATTLVVVTVGEPAEQARIIWNLNALQEEGKELYFVCNRGNDLLELPLEKGTYKSYRLPEDPSMPRKLSPGSRFKPTTPFMKSLSELKEAMYEAEDAKGGIFRRLFGR
ncbi:hypothetical protein V3F56_03215 [Moorellaceae bacterium AZ2]